MPYLYLFIIYIFQYYFLNNAVSLLFIFCIIYKWYNRKSALIVFLVAGLLQELVSPYFFGFFLIPFIVAYYAHSFFEKNIRFEKYGAIIVNGGALIIYSAIIYLIHGVYMSRNALIAKNYFYFIASYFITTMFFLVLSFIFVYLWHGVFKEKSWN
ncbi:MAG: hypothetical protein HYW78_00345 [Parcubacteria group bacterium]|nr:hypothetical protein [Parcubacteria group bacterium]